MYKTLFVGILLSLLGLYLVFNHKQEGKDVMDSYRKFYSSLGLKKLVKTVTKKDDRDEGIHTLIGGIICLILGLYFIQQFFIDSN